MEVNIYSSEFFSDSEIEFWKFKSVWDYLTAKTHGILLMEDGGDGQMVKSRLAAPPSMESRLNWMSLRCLIMGDLTCAIFLQEIFHTI